MAPNGMENTVTPPDRGIVSSTISRIRDRALFVGIVFALLVWYLLIEFAYIGRLPLAPDEFTGAWEVHRLFSGMPYRDFHPYKTVVGYYLQLPVLEAFSDTWQAIMAVKFEMALLNAVLLGFAALRLRRHFRPGAILLGWILLLCMSTFLERSSDLRVDMLTAGAGLLSLLDLLDRRYLRAGLFCALSLLISQKGVYFAVAAESALLFAFLLDRSRRAVSDALVFNGALACGIAIYFGFWSIVAGPSAVFGSTVTPSHRMIALENIYEIRLRFWMQTVVRNPFFYFATASGIITAAWHSFRPTKIHASRVLFPYVSVILALSLWHRQPWPYFFVIPIPIFTVAAILAFDTMLHWRRRLARLTIPVFVTGFILVGVFLPLARVPVNLERSNDFQRETVRLGERLLIPGSAYLAGFDLLFRHTQAPASLRWLDARKINSLHQLPADELGAIREEIRAAPILFLLLNYRIDALPEVIYSSLQNDYQRFTGNIVLYAPVVSGPRFVLKFAGEYLLESPAPITIDGQVVQPGSTLTLAAGAHRADRGDFRLRFVPSYSFTPSERIDIEPQAFFPRIYDY